MRRSILLALALTLGGTGCLAHERGDDAGVDGATPVDASAMMDASARDATGGHDAALGPVDVGLPPLEDVTLPPIDDADAGPDVDAGWMDPPPASTGPCCDVGAIVGLDDVDRQAGSPRAAWADDEWGVAWGDFSLTLSPDDPRQTRFVTLDTNAQPTGSHEILGVLGPLALAYASGRYAVGLQGVPDELAPDYLGLLDRAGSLAQITVVPETIVDITRYAAANDWIVATRPASSDGASEVFVTAYSDSLSAIGSSIDVGAVVTQALPAIVAVKNRLVVLSPRSEGVAYTTFAGGALDRVADGILITPGTYLDERGNARVGVTTAAARMRETLVAVTMDRTNLRAAVLDPFGDVISVPSTPFATSPSQSGHGVAADEIGGTVGVCFPDGAGPYGGDVDMSSGVRTGPPNPDTIRFALLAPDGTPLGAPVTIASGLSYVVACVVAASSADHYVVVFWNAGDAERHSILAASVTVRR